MRPKSLSAICHNFRALLSGEARDLHPNGCTLVFNDLEYESLPLGTGTKIQIHLFDENGNYSENAVGIIDTIQHIDSYWEFRIEWVRPPQSE